MKDAHALKGEVYIQLEAGTADWLDSLEELHLQFPDKEDFKSFKVERAKPFKEGLIVKFEGISDRNASEALRKARVFIDEALLEAEPGETIFLNQLMDFRVWDRDREVGTVVGFMDNGAQDLLRVRRASGPEALIPLVDAYILSIDFDKSQITMDLPPGLLTLDSSEEE